MKQRFPFLARSGSMLKKSVTPPIKAHHPSPLKVHPPSRARPSHRSWALLRPSCSAASMPFQYNPSTQPHPENCIQYHKKPRFSGSLLSLLLILPYKTRLHFPFPHYFSRLETVSSSYSLLGVSLGLHTASLFVWIRMEFQVLLLWYCIPQPLGEPYLLMSSTSLHFQVSLEQVRKSSPRPS